LTENSKERIGIPPGLNLENVPPPPGMTNESVSDDSHKSFDLASLKAHLRPSRLSSAVRRHNHTKKEEEEEVPCIPEPPPSPDFAPTRLFIFPPSEDGMDDVHLPPPESPPPVIQSNSSVFMPQPPTEPPVNSHPRNNPHPPPAGAPAPRCSPPPPTSAPPPNAFVRFKPPRRPISLDKIPPPPGEPDTTTTTKDEEDTESLEALEKLKHHMDEAAVLMEVLERRRASTADKGGKQTVPYKEMMESLEQRRRATVECENIVEEAKDKKGEPTVVQVREMSRSVPCSESSAARLEIDRMRSKTVGVKTNANVGLERNRLIARDVDPTASEVGQDADDEGQGENEEEQPKEVPIPPRDFARYKSKSVVAREPKPSSGVTSRRMTEISRLEYPSVIREPVELPVNENCPSSQRDDPVLRKNDSVVDDDVRPPSYPPPALEAAKAHVSPPLDKPYHTLFAYEYPDNLAEYSPTKPRTSSVNEPKKTIPMPTPPTHTSKPQALGPPRHYQEKHENESLRIKPAGGKVYTEEEATHVIAAILKKEWMKSRVSGKRTLVTRRIHDVVVLFDTNQEGSIARDRIGPLVMESLGFTLDTEDVETIIAALSSNSSECEKVNYNILLKAADEVSLQLRKQKVTGATPFPLVALQNSPRACRRRNAAQGNAHARLQQYERWIASLNIIPGEINLEGFRNGTIFCNLIEFLLAPKNVKLQGVNWKTKGLPKQPCIANIETALSTIWKQNGVKTRNMPTAAEIYNGDAAAIVKLLKETVSSIMFDGNLTTSLRLRPLFQWYQTVLAGTGLEIPQSVLNPPYCPLRETFQDGERLLCVLKKFFPNESCSQTDSIGVAFEIMERHGIPRGGFTARGFREARADDIDMLLLLLLGVFTELQDRPSPTSNTDLDRDPLLATHLEVYRDSIQYDVIHDPIYDPSDM